MNTETQLLTPPPAQTDVGTWEVRTNFQNEKTRCQNGAKRFSGRQRLSVIIPTFNEEGAIGKTLDCLRDGNAWEVIVVDGRSTDRTCEIARAHGATVVASPPGRGQQLATGVSIATGDTLLFLHADTSLPAGYDDHVFRTLNYPDVCAGAFRLLIDGEGRAFRLIETMVNLRSHVRQMPYGDQAIFVRAGVLDEIGGFPDLPIMEDYALIRRLRRLGRIGIAPATVVTSARRWIKRGVWRTALLNQTCIAVYRLGVPAARIARWRERRTR